MRLRHLTIIPFINGLLFFCFKANAQYNESDSMLYKKAKEYAVSLYHENIKNESGLYMAVNMLFMPKLSRMAFLSLKLQNLLTEM